MQEHRVGNAAPVLQNALNADGDVGANLAVLADLGGGVHDDVALVLGAARQLVRGCPPQGSQVQLQPCIYIFPQAPSHAAVEGRQSICTLSAAVGKVPSASLMSKGQA